MTENPENPNTAKTSVPKSRKTIAASSTKLLADLIRKAQPDPHRPIHGTEAIAMLEKVLRAAIKRGVTTNQLVEIMRGLDFDLSPSTLQAYLSKLSRKNSATPKNTEPLTAKSLNNGSAQGSGGETA